MSGNEPIISAPRMAGRTAVILFLFVIIFTAMLSGAYQWTKPAIEASVAEEQMKMIDDLLPREIYDNDLLNDTLTLPPTQALGLDTPSVIYRARKAGAPAALVLEAVAPDGYAGKIRLILAVDHEGKLMGVRVTQHKETPGLGDYVEPRKDKNKAHPWIEQFHNISFKDVSENAWKVKKDGGHFDYYAGATITPRAVTKATLKAMQWIQTQSETLFAAPGEKK